MCLACMGETGRQADRQVGRQTDMHRVRMHAARTRTHVHKSGTQGPLPQTRTRACTHTGTTHARTQTHYTHTHRHTRCTHVDTSARTCTDEFITPRASACRCLVWKRGRPEVVGDTHTLLFASSVSTSDMCPSTCTCERERERESEFVCVCVCARARMYIHTRMPQHPPGLAGPRCLLCV